MPLQPRFRRSSTSSNHRPLLFRFLLLPSSSSLPRPIPNFSCVRDYPRPSNLTTFKLHPTLFSFLKDRPPHLLCVNPSGQPFNSIENDNPFNNIPHKTRNAFSLFT
ncbi:hypothetical protein BC829DRAFT_387158 [Chytridium lagenaria]|nr:hypothetical protein BC829DRAFT_387158 [Chytridium lagenaria]